MINYIILAAVLFQKCESVIYDLDDVEYDRMPPLFVLDQYDICLRHNGTYCVARLNLFAEPTNDLMTLITEYSFHYAKHYNHSIIDRAICVTKTCNKYTEGKNIDNIEELAEIVSACINDTVWTKFGLQSALATLFYCDKGKPDTEPNIFGWIFLALTIFVLLLNVVGSCCDVLQRMNVKDKSYYFSNKIILSISVFKNFEDLKNPRYGLEGLEYLKAFGGAKVLATTAVVFAHTLNIFSFGFTDNPHDFEKAYNYINYQVIFCALSIINIFFVLSGFLLACKLEKKQEIQSLTWSQLPTMMLQRWFRLSMSYTFVLLFSASWLERLGSGPLWKLFVTGGVVAQCRKYWWQHLLYFHNYNSNDYLCMIPSWQIAADIQLFFVGVVVYIVTSPRYRMLALIMLTVLGSAVPAIQIWVQDMGAIVLLYPESYRAVPNYDFLLLHIRGHNNLTCYAIGMAAGSLVYHRQKRGTPFTQHKVTRYLTAILVWTVIPLIWAILLIGYVFYNGEQIAVGIRMAYAAGHRLLLGAIVAFIIIVFANNAMGKRQQSIEVKPSVNVSGFFGWRGWVIPEQLSYCVCLLHMNILHIILGSRTQLEHVSFFAMLLYFVGVLSVAYLLAFPIYLLVEAPTKRILDLFASRTQKNLQQIQRQENQ